MVFQHVQAQPSYAQQAAGRRPEGGRNIGNEYFGLGSSRDFRDFDLLVNGPLVAQLDESFETFWNSDWTYKPEALSEHRIAAGQLDEFRNERREWLDRSEKLASVFADFEDDLSGKLADAHGSFIMAPARVVYDCPPGTRSRQPLQVVEALRKLPGTTYERVFIVSPYVILNRASRKVVRELRDRGVDVTILTNSLEAADHNITFSAYSKRRRERVKMGVNVYELQARGEQWQEYRTPLSSGNHLTMHAKVMLFDDEEIMVGSLNLDPRSKYINTEIGLLIRSRELASRIMEHFQRDLSPENSWHVQMDNDGRLYWESETDRRFLQPARSFFQRFKVLMFRLLPLDHQL